jgi:succinyl-CoA synthetase beta subunit
MKIHEYQAKELLKKFDVPVLKNKIVFDAETAGRIAYEEFESQGTNVIVVKAQVHAGGRGKGDVKNINTGDFVTLYGKPVKGVNVLSHAISHLAWEYSKAMIGNKLITIQTGEAGAIIRKVLIEEGVKIKKEFYLSIVLDRGKSQNVIMASTEGGVEIEKVAEESPEKIIKVHIDPATGFMPFQAREIGFSLGLTGLAAKNFSKFITNLVKAYESLDCSMLEINPMVLTDDDRIIALDAKINFEDNAAFRHPEWAELRDIAEEDPLEVEASKYDLNYIKLDGNVGCMVNGAGLAMATMDLIQMSGGMPANFLDVGGGANVERIANAFRIMMSDPNVKAVLINIFGGIVRCDKVADGIVQALQGLEVNVPVIVRLDGTNAKEGAETLKRSGMKFEIARNFAEAARSVAEVVRHV